MSLTRQTQKIFAGNANADQLAVFGSMKTGTPVYSASLTTLQSTEYTEGWASAIKADKAPYLEEMNAVQYGLSYQLAYLLQEGIPEYDAATEYTDTSVVKTVTDGVITLYVSLANNNIGNSLSDTTYWKATVLNLENKANISLNNTASGAFENLVSTAQSSGKATVVNWGMPNYGSAATRTWATSYSESTAGYVYLQTSYIDDRGDHIITVTQNLTSISFSSAGSTSASEGFRYNLFVPVPYGASWTSSGDATGVTLYWIPCKL